MLFSVIPCHREALVALLTKRGCCHALQRLASRVLSRRVAALCVAFARALAPRNLDAWLSFLECDGTTDAHLCKGEGTPRVALHRTSCPRADFPLLYDWFPGVFVPTKPDDSRSLGATATARQPSLVLLQQRNDPRTGLASLCAVCCRGDTTTESEKQATLILCTAAQANHLSERNHHPGCCA